MKGGQHWRKSTNDRVGKPEQKIEKNYSWKKKYLSLGLHKERPSYRRSLQLSKEAIQHFKT
jgi:hypothetical protein